MTESPFTHRVTFQETHPDGRVAAEVAGVPAFRWNGKWHVRTGLAGTRVTPHPGHRVVEADGTAWVVREVLHLVHQARAILECDREE